MRVLSAAIRVLSAVFYRATASSFSFPEIAGKIGIHAIIVDALDTDSKAFFVKFGFLPLTDNHKRLFLPSSTIQAAAKP